MKSYQFIKTSRIKNIRINFVNHKFSFQIQYLQKI